MPGLTDIRLQLESAGDVRFTNPRVLEPELDVTQEWGKDGRIHRVYRLALPGGEAGVKAFYRLGVEYLGEPSF
jgi:hypothetical protein